MKRIVMIAHPFPPEGSATSYRTLRHVRQLPKLGWSVQVVTATPSQYERYDPNLLALVPDETNVLRVKGYDWWQKFQSWRSKKIQENRSESLKGEVRNQSEEPPTSLRAWLRDMVRTAEARWYSPDAAMPWVKRAVRETVEKCASRKPDVIWANAGRISAFYVAHQVAKRIGVPYVLDFDDAWTVTRTQFEIRKSRSETRQIRHTMYDMLKDAQAVIFRYDSEAECFWRAYRGALDSSRVYIIPNGYEPPIDESVALAGEKCTILYAGTLPDYRYDTLLAALSKLKEADPDRAERLRFLFVGEGVETLGAEAEALGLTGLVETAGPTSYAEANRLQGEAHALLVLGRKPEIQGYELFAGAKLFGYLKAGRPIVGILPLDETRKVLEKVGAQTIANVDSVPEIIDTLRLVVDRWTEGAMSSLAPDRKACEAYSSERQTAILVRALERVPPEQPFIPGSQPIPPSLHDTLSNPAWLDGVN